MSGGGGGCGSIWRSLLLRIGDKCPEYGGSGDHKEHIDTCYSALLREWEKSKDDIFELLQCAEQLPHKIPFYGVLVGLINLENENFAKRIVDTTIQGFRKHYTLKTVIGFAYSCGFSLCCNVVLPGSLVAIFETLLSSAATTIDEDSGNPSWQSCADF